MLQRKQKLELSKPHPVDKEMTNEEEVPKDKGIEEDIGNPKDVPEESMEKEEENKK